MKNYLFTFRSVTYAQKGESVLKRVGTDCFLRRTPKILTNKTCGYCLQIKPWDYIRALTVLQNAQVQFEKVYAMNYDGGFEEMAV